MRKRSEIEKEARLCQNIFKLAYLQLEVLLDIRGELIVNNYVGKQ